MEATDGRPSEPDLTMKIRVLVPRREWLQLCAVASEHNRPPGHEAESLLWAAIRRQHAAMLRRKPSDPSNDVASPKVPAKR